MYYESFKRSVLVTARDHDCEEILQPTFRPRGDAASDPRVSPSTPSCSTQLLNFKRGIKRDISAYPTLKDETYYESFKRSVLVTARAHDCEEILQPTFRPRGDADSLELFRLKNDFMYSVFNKCLLSDMGKTIVRKHLYNMNAQRIWEEFATHMTTSSKGKTEKHRLHTYVTTTVLDKSWKGTTEQFILHFNEQFRQLDEVSPPEESLPYTTRLTLLQTAVHNIPELRMVETMEEFISLSSSTPGPTMGYDNYLTLLQNSCIRYDSNHTSKLSPASRAAYQHELSPDQHDNPYPQDYSSSGTTYGGIDMPAEEFYQVHTTNLNRPPSVSDRIPSTTPGAETPRDARDSGSARSHSTQIETSSSDRPKMVTYTEPQTVSSYMSVRCTRRTLRMPNFTRATNAQPSLSDF